MADFRLLQTPDFLSSYVNAFGAGRAMAKEQGTNDALATYASDPQAGIADLTRYDPRLALQLRGEQTQIQQQTDRRNALALWQANPEAAKAAAAQSGDTELLDWFSKQEQATQTTATRNATALHNLAVNLQTRPYEERKAILDHLSPQLLAAFPGITQESLAGFDPTDANIEAIAGHLKPLVVGGSVLDPSTMKPLYEQPQHVPFGWRINPDTGAAEVDPSFVAGSGKIAAARHVTGGGRGGGRGGAKPSAPPAFSSADNPAGGY